MKKNVLIMSVLMMGGLLVSCGPADNAGEADTLSDMVEGSYQPSVSSDTDTPEAGETSWEGLTEEELKEAAVAAAGEMEEYVEVDVLLSDKILKEGDTMQVTYFDEDGILYNGLDVTLCRAQFFDSPEAAGLNRAQMLSETENYDVLGNPEWCSIDDAGILVCDLTVRNMGGNSKEDMLGMETDLHIGELMIAYEDPDTQKVTIVSCAPVYLSASSSEAGASDYYHYQVPKGESRDITVAWAIQREYEVENLYLCVTYDNREAEERQYFKCGE